MRKIIREKTIDRLSEIDEINDSIVKEIISNEVIYSDELKEISLKEKLDLIDRVFADIRGFDVLQTLIDDEEITEIMVNGIDNIFIEKNGKLEKTELKFDDEERLEYVIQKMVSTVGRTVNTMNPIVDARLESGDRINVVLPPASIDGATLTIRKFKNENLSIDNLVKKGSLSKECAEEIKEWVKLKYNIFVSGGTGSGKTTFLNALAEFIHPQERLISIEDSAELKLKNIKNWVRLESRNANSEGEGEITIRDLLKTSLRMRPDRIIVGEIRGKEAIDMLQAMNTGHDGSLSTGHANSPLDMLRRIETMVMSAVEIPLAAIKSQINSAIDIVIHLTRFADGSRKVNKVSVLSDSLDGEYNLVDIYEFRKEEGENINGISGKLHRNNVNLEKIKKLERKNKWKE